MEKSFPVLRRSYRTVATLLLYVFFMAVTGWGFVSPLVGCRAAATPSEEQARLEHAVGCTLTDVNFPTTVEQFNHLYKDRGFYTDGNHLGRDIDLPEGTPIHPIGCGTIRVYRPAQGYGTLAVVIEHALPMGRTLVNGLGLPVQVKRMLTIYAHLRSTEHDDAGTVLKWKEGDTVGPNDVIGYVQNGKMNGDGGEHLHFGVRLQGAVEAERTDQNWFRGYDAMPSQRQWFADPVTVIYTLMQRSLVVSWHPVGSFLVRQDYAGEQFLVTSGGVLRPVSPTTVWLDHLDHPLVVSDSEIGCYNLGTTYISQMQGASVRKFDDSPIVYQYQDDPPGRTAFISHEAFLSWGWTDLDIDVSAARLRADFFAAYPDQGFRLMRDGALVKAKGSSEVSVVSNGQRLPLADWATLLALGYDPSRIVEIDPKVIDAVAFARGPTITPKLIAYCGDDGTCSSNVCQPEDGGMQSDASQAPPDAAVPLRDLAYPPDMAVPLDLSVAADLIVNPDLTKSPDLAPPPDLGTRYEFRVLASAQWQAAEPFRLRDQWWSIMSCMNTGSSNLEVMSDGWHRCDLSAPLTPFIGSFYSNAHPMWGDQGQLGTVGNAPQSCTSTLGVEWRITNLANGALIFQGPSLQLPCVTVSGQSRHLLP